MKQKTVIVLIGLALVLGALALMVDRRGRAASGEAALGERPMLFPDMAAKVNDVASLSLVQAKEKLTIRKSGDAWVVEEKGGYPAQFEKVKEALLSMSRLQGVEAKTANPERFVEISVQEPGSAPAKEGKREPTLVTAAGPDGKPMASAIIGDMKWGSRPQVFVRKAGENQSWLAEVSGGTSQARFDVPVTLAHWVSTEIANIARDRVSSVVLRHPAEPATAEGGAAKEAEVIAALRDDPAKPSFTLREVPAGRSLKAANVGDSLANAVSYLNFEDVKPAAEMAAAFADDKTTVAEYRTFDGLMLTARLVTVDGKMWAMFEPAFDESAAAAPEAVPEGATPEQKAEIEGRNKAAEEKVAGVRNEVEGLKKKMEGWAFQVPEWKARTFMTRWNDLLSETGSEAGAAEPGAVVGQ